MSTPKILTIDIETSPNLADVWGLWDQNISLNQLHASTRMICFAAKWHGKSKVHFASEFHHDPRLMVEYAHELVSEADILVHYNGIQFDVKHLNREFLLAGLTPPPPVQQIDLLRVVKARFKFPSNKLEYVADKLGVGSKLKHQGHDMWVKCQAGDPAAWATMKRYCINDVVIEERVYDALRAWVPNHPNMLLFTDDMAALACTRCGSANMQRRGKTRTLTRVSQRYQCQDCGGWGSSSRSDGGTSLKAA